MQAELWSETRSMSQHEILGGLLRQEFKKENIRRIDCSYLAPMVDHWWITSGDKENTTKAFGALQKLLIENLKPEHLSTIQGVGLEETKISAVFLEYVFSIPDKELAKTVHEVTAKIAGIVDIKYPYEEHKELFPKTNDVVASDWGKGLGIIRPHSDDLYEERDINIMSLTVCKDTSATPTWFWLLSDVVSCLTNEELSLLAMSEATFYSGANVEGTTIKNRKPILRRNQIEGLGLRLDFRIDDSIGPRMRFDDIKLQEIVAKMREGLKVIRPLASNPSTGSVSILANFKVLHGRSHLNPIMLYDGESSRILFRSKGIK